jgi:hypothetical protein
MSPFPLVSEQETGVRPAVFAIRSTSESFRPIATMFLARDGLKNFTPLGSGTSLPRGDILSNN